MRVLYRIAGVAIGILLILSLAANWLLLQETNGNYRDLHRVRLDPLGLSAYAEATPPPADGDLRRVVLYGDSRAAEWITPEVAGVIFINRGVGAQTTAQVLGRFSQDIAPLRPHTLVMQAGVNDLKTVALFPEQAAEIIQNTKDNLREIVRLAQEAGVEQVILTTIFPVGDVPLERQMVWSDAIAAAIDEVNADLAALASERVTVLATAPILADASGRVAQPYSHPTAMYPVWQAIANAITAFAATLR